MKSEIKKGEKSTCTLTVKIEEAEIKEANEKALVAAMKTVSVPGFRKGKAPRRLAEQAINQAALRARVMEDLIESSYPKAVEENKIRPISRPEINITNYNSELEIEYTAKVDIYPELELDEASYKHLKLEVEKEDIKEAAVQKAIEFLREQAAIYTPIEEDRGLQEGDYALVDFLCTVKGKKVKEGSVTNYTMQVIPASFVPGFTDSIIGVKKGETKEFDITFPEDYHSVLKGKNAKFKFTLHEIQTKTLPELDDEFAKQVSEYDTYEKMLEDINNRMDENANARTLNDSKNVAGEKLAETIKVDLPESLIQAELNGILSKMAQSYARQGLDIFKNLDDEQIRKIAESRRAEAEKYSAVQVILHSIAKKENITVTEEEVNTKLAEISGGRDVRKMRRDLIKSGRIAEVEEGILLDKTLEFVVENADITYKVVDVKEEEVTTDIAKETAEAEAKMAVESEEVPVEEVKTEEVKTEEVPAEESKAE